jgi:hypothetical protein
MLEDRPYEVDCTDAATDAEVEALVRRIASGEVRDR